MSIETRTKPQPPPKSQGYPTLAPAASTIKFRNVKGKGLFPPPNGGFSQPDFSDPKLQKNRDPAFYAKAAAQRTAKLNTPEYAYDDGLTVLERRQKFKLNQETFLTGNAKSQIDETAILGEIDAPAFGGINADRFQLLFISVFGLFTLVGSLANAKPYV